MDIIYNLIFSYIKWLAISSVSLFCIAFLLILMGSLFSTSTKTVSDGRGFSSSSGTSKAHTLFSFIRLRLIDRIAEMPAPVSILVIFLVGYLFYITVKDFFMEFLLSILSILVHPSEFLILLSAVITSYYFIFIAKVDTFKKWVQINDITEDYKKVNHLKGFSLIGGYDEVKRQLKTAVENILSDSPIKTNGILLYGPPGCGKTYFAEKTAEEFGIKYKKVHIDEVKSMWVNESTSLVGKVFKDAIAEQPCVLVFDEIDGLVQSREDKSTNSEDYKVTNAFLTHIDDIRKSYNKVVIMATTNYYDRMDKAFIRAGRFDYHVRINRPDRHTMKEIIKVLLQKTRIFKNDQSFRKDLLQRHLNVHLNMVLNIVLWTFAIFTSLWLIGLSLLHSSGEWFKQKAVKTIANFSNSDIEGISDSISMIQDSSWLSFMSIILFILTISGFAIKKEVFRAISKKRAKKQGKKSDKDSQFDLVIDKLSEYFDGRNVSDIETAINIALTKYGNGSRNLTDFAELIIRTDKENKKLRRNAVPGISWDDVILNDDIKEELKKITVFIGNYKSMKQKYTRPLKGLILHGEPGNGKTLIAKAIASNADCSFYFLKPSDIVDKYVGETQKKIAEIYRQARESAPSIVFIDEAESLFEARDTSKNNDSVTQILQEIEGFDHHDDVVFTVIATNYPDRIDDAIKSRLSHSIHIPNPDRISREKLIKLFISKITHSGEFNYSHLADITEGMSARDIENLINKSANVDFTKPLEYKDIIQTIEKQKGREKPILSRKYTWDDLVVSEQTLKQLKSIEAIFKHPEKARSLGIKKGINAIFYGEPGTGKTHAAKVLASVLNADFKEYVGGDFKKGIVGETEKMIRDAFKWLKSRPAAVMYIDESDSILMNRMLTSAEHSVSCVNQFLAELQGFEETGHNYAVIISTNLIDRLDPAVVSRFPIKIYFGLPDEQQREKLLNLYIKDAVLKNVDMKWLVKNTEGYSGRDIDNLINKAKMNALTDNRDYLVQKDFF